MSWAVCIGTRGDLGRFATTATSCRRSRLSNTRSTWTTATRAGPAIPWRQADATDAMDLKRKTHAARCELSAALVAEANGSWVVWCSTDDESKLLLDSFRRGRGQRAIRPSRKSAAPGL